MKTTDTTLFENAWCRVIGRDTFYVLQSKKGHYNDQYFNTLDQLYQRTGIDVNSKNGKPKFF